MKKYLVNPSKTDSLLLAVMFALGGLVLCMFSGSLLTTIVRILGLVLVVYGCYELYVYFGLHRSTNMSPMIIGVPAAILGLFLACWPNMLINFFPIIAGILLIFNSIVQIQRALVLRSSGISSWTMTLVFALIALAVGVFLVIRPGSMVNILLRLTGFALIFEAVAIVFDVFTGKNVSNLTRR